MKKFLLLTTTVVLTILNSVLTQATQNITTSGENSSILNFRIPTDETVLACLIVTNITADFKIYYLAEYNNTFFNESTILNLNNYSSYTGECINNNTINTLTITFFNNWTLSFNYSLFASNSYSLNSINLTYTLNREQFPNVASNEVGKTYTAYKTNLNQFSTHKDISYKCFTPTLIPLNTQVSIQISNYMAQPFLTEKNQNLDTAVECLADTFSGNKLVPIIVGSALGFLIVVFLVAYIIGRRKHVPGYHQV